MPHVKSFLNYLLLEKRYSSHTIRAYKTDLLLFQQFLEKVYEVKIQKADKNMIRSWLVEELNRGNSPRTTNRKITSLKTFYKFLIKEKIIDINPTITIESSKTSKKIPSFLTEDEIHNLLDNIEHDESYIGVRNKLMVELFYSTGVRLSELINIKIKDLDFNNNQLKVLGKRNKQRIIPFVLQLGNSIEIFIAKRSSLENFNSPYLFITDCGKKMNPSAVYRIINKLISSVTSLHTTSPHVLRHTFATHMLNNGADLNVIKELLGHASLTATEIYTHNSIQKLKQVYKNAHPRA